MLDDELQQPKKKRRKYEGDDVLAVAAITSKLLSLASDIWKATSFSGKLTNDDVKLSFDQKKSSYKGTVRCLICLKDYAICYRVDSITIPSYKSHVMKHLSKSKENTNQPKIMEALKKRNAADGTNASVLNIADGE